MDKKTDEGGGGSGGSGQGAGQGQGQGDDSKKQLDDLRSMNTKLLERLEKLEKTQGGGAGKDDDEGDLAQKAKLEREKKEKSQVDSKRLESALKYAIQVKDWAKTNASLLPKTIESILDQAEKEKYDVATEKDSAIKAGIISEFFALQANLDLLTESQKILVEDFAKLTKTSRHEKAHQMYEQIFEPTFEMLKRIKKAEQIGKGHSNQTDAENAYKEKLMNTSKKHYLRGAKNA